MKVISKHKLENRLQFSGTLLGDPNDLRIDFFFLSFSFFSFHPILFVDFLINQPIELLETLTNVRYWANLVLATFWGHVICLWRHLGAILWKHIIDHISIMNGQFWFILGKTKVYMNRINFNGLARAQRACNARNCASKFQNGQNDLLS